MCGILNVLINVSLWLFNFTLEIRYKIKRLIFKRQHPVDIEINDIYLIKEVKKTIPVEDFIIKKINNSLKYSNYVPLNFIINGTALNKTENDILEIKYKKHNKNYIFNIPVSRLLKENIFFPTYNVNDMKNRNMNRITDINGPTEYLDILNEYSGPLNDFYISKDLGIPLKNIYYNADEAFPFRENKYIIEDTFLNEYFIGGDSEYNSESVFNLKNTLDNSKISKNDKNEEFILSKYKKMKFDGKMIFWDLFNYLFGRKKEA